MAYTINLTNGEVLTSVSNGTIENTSTSLVLIGKNYAGYGEFVAENFVRLLENAANSTPPVNPLVGQLWYDTIGGNLNIYNGVGSTGFKTLALATSSAEVPEDPTVGDQWFDTVNSQLYVWNGDQFVLIGPAFTGGTSGAVADTIVDTIAVEHVVVKLVVDDAVVGIVSKDAEFTPAIAIGGFSATIKPGIQLAENIGGQIPIFDGTATAADALNVTEPSTETIDANNFLRSDVDDWTTGKLEIRNDSGLWVGADNDARLTVSGTAVRLSNSTASGDIRFNINSTDRLIIDGITNNVTVDASLTVTGNSTVEQDLTVEGDISTATGSRVFIETGTAADPGLTFRTDSAQDTGMWSSGDGFINFSTNAQERLEIDNVGRLSVATPNYETLVTTDDAIPNKKYVDDTITALLNAMYPVGAIFVGANPSTVPLMPGTWTAAPAGTFLQAEGNGSQGAAETYGGANTKTLSIAEMPAHNHGGAAGSHRHTYDYTGTHTINDIGIMGTGGAPKGIIVGSWGVRNTGYASGGSIASQGSSASWDKRPYHRVVEMWIRTA